MKTLRDYSPPPPPQFLLSVERISKLILKKSVWLGVVVGSYYYDDFCASQLIEE
jgi:hypothetical protein